MSVAAETLSTPASAPPSTRPHAPPGVLRIGDAITFSLKTTAPVQVTPSSDGGYPALALNNGGTADYLGQDRNGFLLFRYTVGDGQLTPDLKVTGLTLNGATIVGAGFTFQSRTDYGAVDWSDRLAPWTTFVAAVDVSGDGNPDVIVTSESKESVSVLLGDGSGHFAPQAAYATVGLPLSVVVADMNGDGRPDLVTTDYQHDTVSVLPGDGTGGFLGPLTYLTQSCPISVAVGDVNGDGKPDLVTGNSGVVSVLLAGGAGGFAAPVDYGTGSGPYSVAIADVSGDGKADIVTANGQDKTISVLLGDGSGSFAGQVPYHVGIFPYSAVVGDVSGDGKPDIIVANGSGDTVSVLLGSGDGRFQSQVEYNAGSGPLSVAIADVNCDGKPDLVASNSDANTVSVLLGDGIGGFAARTAYATGATPFSVAVADFNRDGRPDLVTANWDDGTVSVLLNAATDAGVFDASGLATLAGADTGYGVACFLAGTLIRTEHGEVPVEALRSGDRVLTTDGVQPVIWIGTRNYVLQLERAHERAALMPIRIAAGALGGEIPQRDLYVSPEHGLCLHGVLVAAKHLVNGTTIKPSGGSPLVRYFHVELARHGLLYAEGAEAESYRDVGNRNMFGNVLDCLDRSGSLDEPKQPPCRPMVAAGPLLDAIRAGIEPCSAGHGRPENRPGPAAHLHAGGAAVRPPA